MRALRRSLSNAIAGRGGVALLSGPAGVGKTETLWAFGREAADKGALLLTAEAFSAKQRVPLGVLGQLFACADPTPEQSASLTQLLARTELDAMLRNGEEEAIELAGATELHQLTSMLVDFSIRQPLLIGVDDFHFADITSVQGLLHLIHRIGDARIFVVLTESSSIVQRFPLLRAELVSHPLVELMHLDRYSVDDVAAVLAKHPDLPALDPASCHEATGGNPRLVHALIEDARKGAERVPAGGTAFGRAVLTGLLRSDPALLRVAQILALAEQPVGPELLSDVLGTDVASTEWALAAGAAAGLLDGPRFRHEGARAAVLDIIGPRERVDMHRQLAHRLYESGAPAVEIARHKIAARHADAAWSTTVLREAARSAAQDDDLNFALSCLWLADSAPIDEAERAETRSAIFKIKWRIDPTMAERDVGELVEAARAGQLNGTDTVALVNHLCGSGRPAEAGELFDRAGDTTRGGDSDLDAAVYSTGMRLAYTYPGVFKRSVGRRLGRNAPRSATARGRLRIRSATLIGTLLTEGLTEPAVVEAQAVLQEGRLSTDTYEPMLSALETMILAEQLQPAAQWCDALLRQAEERRVPTWCAHLMAVRSIISFRLGDLAAAERFGRLALFWISPRGFGVYVGVPISVLLLVATRLGDFDSAQKHLGVQVPEAMFQTPIGLHYLWARGRYYLALRQYRAAIEDFETCGDLMSKWSLDLPGIAPWRTDLAEANLTMGAPARELVLDQLALLGSYNERTRGISLRVLAAATPDLNRRPRILRDAIDLLRGSGDQLELAEALANLSEAEQALGEYSKARVTSRRAKQLARRSKVRLRGLPMPTAEVKEPARPAVAADDPLILKLSDAERRVVSLAAQGMTNRQIATKLFITVSTVEQHLTRAYRKLGVRRRSDLPATLISWLIHVADVATVPSAVWLA